MPSVITPGEPPPPSYHQVYQQPVSREEPRSFTSVPPARPSESSVRSVDMPVAISGFSLASSHSDVLPESSTLVRDVYAQNHHLVSLLQQLEPYLQSSPSTMRDDYSSSGPADSLLRRPPLRPLDRTSIPPIEVETVVSWFSTRHRQ